MSNWNPSRIPNECTGWVGHKIKTKIHADVFIEISFVAIRAIVILTSDHWPEALQSNEANIIIFKLSIECVVNLGPTVERNETYQFAENNASNIYFAAHHWL